MMYFMTWAQFLVLADVFQTHLRNTSHLDLLLPAIVFGTWGCLELRKLRKALEDITEALRLR